MVKFGMNLTEAVVMHKRARTLRRTPEKHFHISVPEANTDIVAHVCKSRSLSAGTLVGSGTISNEDRSRGSSCLAEKRMIEKIDTGEFTTPFMNYGDTVAIEMFNPQGDSLFGRIEQTVVKKD